MPIKPKRNTQDPNKVYLPNGTEARRMTRNERDAAYKASRERFLSQRKRYKDMPILAQTVKEAEAAARRAAKNNVRRNSRGVM